MTEYLCSTRRNGQPMIEESRIQVQGGVVFAQSSLASSVKTGVMEELLHP